MELNSIRRKVTTAPKEWFPWKEVHWPALVKTLAKGWWVSITSHSGCLVVHWPLSLCVAYSVNGAPWLCPSHHHPRSTAGTWVSVGQALPEWGWLNCCASWGISALWKESFLMGYLSVFSLCLRSLRPNSRTTSSRQPFWRREMPGFGTSRRPLNALKEVKSLQGSPPGGPFDCQKPLT